MSANSSYEVHASASRAASRSDDLFRRTREIHQLAMIARDCAAPGAARDLTRVERTLAKIADLAGGGVL